MSNETDTNELIKQIYAIRHEHPMFGRLSSHSFPVLLSSRPSLVPTPTTFPSSASSLDLTGRTTQREQR
eukprot:766270-Hanusia_phi.AAC.2